MMKGKLDFHVVDSVSAAYRFVWQNRRTCLYIAGLPFLIKVGCLAAILMMDLQDNLLRQGLLLMPSYFAEGWMVGLLVRVTMEVIVQREARPANVFALKKDHIFISLIGPREKRLITASMIMYVLIQIVYTVVMHALKASIDNKNPASLVNGTSPVAFLFSILLIAVILWAVRLAWLHVPVAMGRSVKDYMRIVHPYTASFYMIGISLLCSVPVAITILIILKLAGGLFMLSGVGAVFAIVLAPALQAFAQISAAMIGSIAMTHALYPLLMKKP